MKKSKKKDCNRGNLLVILMSICVILSLAMLAIVAYDKLIREQCKPCSCLDTTAVPTETGD